MNTQPNNTNSQANNQQHLNNPLSLFLHHAGLTEKVQPLMNHYNSLQQWWPLIRAILK